MPCTQLGTHFFRCTQRTVPRAQRCGLVLHVVSAPVTEIELSWYAVVCQEAVHAAYPGTCFSPTLSMFAR